MRQKLESSHLHCARCTCCEINQNRSKAKELHKMATMSMMSSEMSKSSTEKGAGMHRFESVSVPR